MASLTFDIFARDKTGQAFASVKNNVDGLNKGFSNISKTIGAFKALLVGAFAVNYLKGAAQAAEQINDLSTKLGIGAEVLSQYQLVANNTGVSLDDIGNAMKHLAKNSIDAVESGGEAAKALQYLGINAQQFAAMPIDTKFQLLAEAIRGVENPSKRVELAMTLMGKSGADMLQVMAGGGQALQEMQQRADELGITLTQTQVTAVDGMMDAFGELGLAAKGVAQDFVGLFAPAIQAIANALTYVLVGAVNIVKSIFKSLVATILDVIGRIANAFSWLTRQFSILPGQAGDAMKQISESLSNYGDVLTSVSSKAEEATKTNAGYQAGIDKTAASIDKVNKALAKGGAGKAGGGLKGMQKDLGDTGKVAKDTADDMAKKWGDAAQSMENDISGALGGMSLDFNDLKGSALRALEAIGESILKNILNQQLGTNGGGGGGGGSGFGGFVSSALGSLWDMLPSFAGGGDHAGGLRVVGENGPELEATGKARIYNAHQTQSMLAGASAGTSARPVNVQMNITTPDANSFRRSQSQITAAMAQAVQQGARNL